MLIVSQRLQQDIITFTLQHWTFNKSASNTSFQHYDLLRQLFSGWVFCIKFRFEPAVRRLAPPPAFLHVFLSPPLKSKRDSRTHAQLRSRVLWGYLPVICGSAVFGTFLWGCSLGFTQKQFLWLSCKQTMGYCGTGYSSDRLIQESK